VDKGRDFEGCDCWGLVCLFNYHITGVHIPDYAGLYISADDSESVSKAIECEKGNWKEIDYSGLKAGDVILLRTTEGAAHTGVNIGHNKMIHTAKGHNSVVDNFLSAKWKDRIEGFYRWVT
jgi:cell wall-associated NlpC family hydrolase